MVKPGGRKNKKKVRKDVAKILNKGRFGRNILLSSGYFQTMADPFNVHGEKIPDFVNYPSGTFSMLYRRTGTCNATTGDYCIVFGLAGNASNTSGSLVPVQWTNAVSGNTNYTFGTEANGPLKSDIIPTPGSGAILLPQWTDSTGIPFIYEKVRLVSAGFALDYLGTALGAKGSITVVSLPRNFFRDKASNGAITLSDIQNAPGARIIPINRLAGGSCVYHPLDLKDLEYTDLGLKYDNSSLTTFAAVEQALGGEIYFYVADAEPDAQVQITACLNYEGIPISSALNIVQATPSHADPIDLAMSMNAIDKVPKAHEGTAAVQGLVVGSTQLPSAQSPSHNSMTSTSPSVSNESTFMEKLLGGADSLSTMIDKGSEIGSKLAPLVEGALAFL